MTTSPLVNGSSAANGSSTKAQARSFQYPTEGRVQPRSRTKRPFTEEDIRQFKEICSQRTNKTDYPLADSIAKNAVVYDAQTLHAALTSQSTRDEAMAELHHCLLAGPGVYVIKRAFAPALLDRVTEAFQRIISREKAATGPKGDHFAPAGKNDRIWNSFQKHAEDDPASFVEYYANELLALACEAWLGPGYQITAQTNVVKPGGRAQEPHRDYHLGFQDETTAARFPIVSQIASQLLTLQGAVAHTDMPLESGPTQLLPFSQHFDYGYQAYRHESFARVFKDNMVQVPLEKGDALFFNPALFHAAGDNDTEDFHRVANLVQISACWGKAMETVDRQKMVEVLWDEMSAFSRRDDVSAGEVEALFAAVADGYSFPTNLDRDPPPAGGHCPPTMLDMARQSVQEGVDKEEIRSRLDEYATKRLA